MVMPAGHARRLREPLGLSRRDRRLLALIAGVFVATALALGIYAIAKGGRTLGPGCISATFASATGGGEIRNCGAQARNTCRQAFAMNAATAPGTGAIQHACRATGYTPESLASSGSRR